MEGEGFDDDEDEDDMDEDLDEDEDDEDEEEWFGGLIDTRIFIQIYYSSTEGALNVLGRAYLIIFGLPNTYATILPGLNGTSLINLLFYCSVLDITLLWAD